MGRYTLRLKRLFRELKILGKRRGFEITPAIEEQLLANMGHTGGLFQKLLGLRDEDMEGFFREWEHTDVTHPVALYPGTTDTLEWAREYELCQCMLTSRYRHSLMQVLERERLTGYFAKITARCDHPYHKPDARSFDPILEHLAKQGINKEECLYIGDSWVDIEAGKNAGVRTVVVKTGHYATHHYKTHPFPATHVIGSIADLPTWIEREPKKQKGSNKTP